MTITRYFLTTSPQAVPDYTRGAWYDTQEGAMAEADRRSLCVVAVQFTPSRCVTVHDGRARSLFPEPDWQLEASR